jgi:hypothetical protein
VPWVVLLLPADDQPSMRNAEEIAHLQLAYACTEQLELIP